jgi:hypothetical protein
MKTGRTIILASLMLVSVASSAAAAEGCISKIRTVENMLVRLSEVGQVGTDGKYAAGLFRRVDIPSAKDHLSEAKAYLEEALELNCELHIFEAMRRLGVES